MNNENGLIFINTDRSTRRAWAIHRLIVTAKDALAYYGKLDLCLDKGSLKTIDALQKAVKDAEKHAA